MAAGDWETALQHYNQAVSLAPGDSELLFARGMIYYQLDKLNDAEASIQAAIDMARLYSDIAYYKLQLQEVRKAQLGSPRATAL